MAYISPITGIAYRTESINSNMPKISYLAHVNGPTAVPISLLSTLLAVWFLWPTSHHCQNQTKTVQIQSQLRTITAYDESSEILWRVVLVNSPTEKKKTSAQTPSSFSMPHSEVKWVGFNVPHRRQTKFENIMRKKCWKSWDVSMMKRWACSSHCWTLSHR